MDISKSRLGKSFFWKILILSLFSSTIFFYFFDQRIKPFRLSILEKSHSQNFVLSYHDFNDDGYSESLELYRLPESKRYYIQIKNWSGGIIDQTNYWEMFEPSWIMYEDITGDGFDEILTFTLGFDSLFFYAHDIMSKKTLINRLYLARLEEPRTSNNQSVNFLKGFLADKALYDNQVIIFGTNSFTSLKPRTIFALDLEEQRIINTFETSACLSNLFAYDLTGDGINEVIATSVAYGNVNFPAKYGDDKCWLFVLDQELNPIFTPLSFSEYPAEFIATPVESFSKRYLLAVPFFLGEKNLDRLIYLINAAGKIHLRKQNPFVYPMGYGNVLSSGNNPSELIGWQGKDRLIILNHRLDMIRQYTTPFDAIQVQSIKDLDGDGNAEILCNSDKFISIFNSELKLLSSLSFQSRPMEIGFRKTGPNSPRDIVLLENNFQYQIKYERNKSFVYLPVMYIVIFFSFMLFFSVLYKILIVLAIYIFTFRHYLYNSAYGILIVGKNGRCIAANNRIQSIFGLTGSFVRGKFVDEVFHDFPKVMELIRDVIDNHQSMRKKIEIEGGGKPGEIELYIQPFHFQRDKGLFYFIEIMPILQDSHSEKTHIWSRTVQKMAHDIKTPLSTVNLNLKVLQTRLEKMNMPNEDRLGLRDDMEMMRGELEHIQKMTRNFLKFSNLDKPHFQAFDIKTVIDESVKKYQPYLSPDQRIEVRIDQDLKAVWADPQQIELVFHSLIENALSAIQNEGFIQISGIMAQDLEKNFSEYLELEIADTGPGIPEQERLKIFEPYYTTKTDGTGLGLAIARKIIDDHGGTIEVHSKENFGAVILFSLPVIAEEDDL